MTSDEDRLLDILTTAHRILSRELAERLAEEDVSVDQWRILHLLGRPEAESGTPTGELAARTQIAAPTLTRLIDALVDRGLVYRRQSERDRRQIDLFLSTVGRGLLARLEAIADAHEQVLAERLGSERLSEAVRILRRMLPDDARAESAVDSAPAR